MLKRVEKSKCSVVFLWSPCLGFVLLLLLNFTYCFELLCKSSQHILLATYIYKNQEKNNYKSQGDTEMTMQSSQMGPHALLSLFDLTFIFFICMYFTWSSLHYCHCWTGWLTWFNAHYEMFPGVLKFFTVNFPNFHCSHLQCFRLLSTK